jgi:MinD superfamily P-loop ATPase
LTPPVCHACGGCAYLCPVKATSESPRAIGAIERGRSGEIDVRTGILNPGEVSGVPIIRDLLADIGADENLCGLKGSPTQVVETFVPVHNVDSEMIEGEPAEQARKLADKLMTMQFKTCN